jgi:hypothetical protein
MQRIQRKRIRGWQTPAGAVYVGRPSNWANRHDIYVYGWRGAVALFREDLEAVTEEEREAWLAPLRPATALVCWCPLDKPCHADVLIEYLNKPMT